MNIEEHVSKAESFTAQVDEIVESDDILFGNPDGRTAVEVLSAAAALHWQAAHVLSFLPPDEREKHTTAMRDKVARWDPADLSRSANRARQWPVGVEAVVAAWNESGRKSSHSRDNIRVTWPALAVALDYLARNAGGAS